MNCFSRNYHLLMLLLNVLPELLCDSINFIFLWFRTQHEDLNKFIIIPVSLLYYCDHWLKFVTSCWQNSLFELVNYHVDKI